MRRSGAIFLYALLAMVGASPLTRADVVLFSDNFNVTPGTGSTDNTNYQYNAAGRQGGISAPLQYAQNPPGDDPHHSLFTAAGNLGQPLRLSADSAANNTTVSPNADFARQPFGNANVTIQFDVDANDPRASASSSSSFLALSFGGGSQNILVDGPADHMGLLLRGNGAFRLYDGSANVTPGGGDLPDATGGGGQFTTVSISITDPDGNPFDGAGTATITFSSNATGVFAVYSRADFLGNFLTFQSQTIDANTSVSYVDNLTITAVPEAGGVGAIVMGSFALLMSRRRIPRQVD